MQTPSNRACAEELAIVIMGVSGCGKSTLGALLAQRLGCRFLEGDDFHDSASVAKMRAGQPLMDDDRWPWLDRLGLAIRTALKSETRIVAACSALRLCYRDRLRTAIAAPVRFVLLDLEREELLRRLALRSNHYMPTSLLESQLATLEHPTAGEEVFIPDALQQPKDLCDCVDAWVRNSAIASQNLRPSGH